MITTCLSNPSRGQFQSWVILNELPRSEHILYFLFLDILETFLPVISPKIFMFVLQKFPTDEGFRITTLVFFTPMEKRMTVAEAQRSGYWIRNTATRLLLRSPKSTPETYTQKVRGLHSPDIFARRKTVVKLPAANLDK